MLAGNQAVRCLTLPSPLRNDSSLPILSGFTVGYGTARVGHRRKFRRLGFHLSPLLLSLQFVPAAVPVVVSRFPMATESASLTGFNAAAPLLGARGNNREWRFGLGPGLSGAAQFLRRASRQRMMREPSMLVRETAAERLGERRTDWAYSKPVVVLGILWNHAFVTVAAVVLVMSWAESPSVPLRLWIAGYSLQCVLHMVCVCIECTRWHQVEDASP